MTADTQKKHYEKPFVKKVKLAIDEAVLQPCKGGYGDNAGKGGPPKYCGHPGCKNTYGS